MISRPSILAVVRLLFLAACAAALRLPARGAGVPSSVADYIFTVPRLTNHIRGVVITSTNAYRVIRSEDVDWLREAFAERWGIIYGGVPSRPSPGVGAHVSDAIDETGGFWNGWPRGSDSGWLDPDTQLLSGARVYDSGEKVTNTYVVVAYSNAVTNAFSTIEMPRTNGTVCVYTNRYQLELRVPYNQVMTNVHSMTPLDYCRAGDGVFGGYTNTPIYAFGYPSYNGMRTPSIGEITNAWAALRGTKRLADVGIYSITNSPVIFDEYANYYVSDAQTYHGTNDVRFGVYGYDLASTCYTNGHWMTRAVYNPPFTAYIPTRFDSSIGTAGGANRVSMEAAFVYFHFSYFFSDARHPDSYRAVQKYAVVRLPSPSLDISGHNAIAVVRVDTKSLCSAAATAAGCPPVPSAGVMYSPQNGESHNWKTEGPRFIFIYSITPSVKLPDW